MVQLIGVALEDLWSTNINPRSPHNIHGQRGNGLAHDLAAGLEAWEELPLGPGFIGAQCGAC